MSKLFLGIDVSEYSLKIVELEKKKGEIFLKNYDIISLRELENQEGKEEEILLKIEGFLRQNKVKAKKANIVISGQSVFTRLVKLPAVEKSKLEQIVQYEAQQQIPFPISEVVWSYQILEQVEGEGDLNALLVAVKSEVATRTFLKFSSKKFNLEVMDISPLALCNALRWNKLISDNVCTAVLNLGAHNTYIVIIDNGLIWTRYTPLGGDNITEAIAKELNKSYEEATKIKKEYKGGSNPEEILDEEAKKINSLIEKNTSRLLAEVSRSIGFYRTQFLGSSVEKILVTGGGSFLQGIMPMIQERYSKVSVERVDIFSNIVTDADILREKDFKNDKQLLGEAVGLALRGITDCPLKIDLIPYELKRKKFIAAQQKYVVISTFLIILYLIAYLFYSRQVVKINEESLKALGNIVTESRMLGRERKKLIQETTAIDKKHMVLKECIRLRSFWLEMLLEIDSVIPKNIWLINIYPSMGGKSEEPKVVSGRRRRSRAVSAAQTVAGSGFEEISTIIIEGKTTGMYKDLIQFRDSLKKSLYFVEEEDGVKIISAKPPVRGERDFVLSVRLENPVPGNIEG